MPRLGAIGSLVLDTIEYPSSPPVDQPGGAIYSIAGLSAARPAGWSIFPIVNLGADAVPAVMHAIRAMHGVETDHISIVPQPNNRVHLRYVDEARRTETLTGGVPPLPLETVLRAVSEMSALYINFIAGDELTLGTAEALRARFRGFIYADLHSLFLAPPGHGPRLPRRLEQWERWFAAFDAVQLNEDELALLGCSIDDLPALVSTGPRLSLVTRGAQGAAYAERTDKNGERLIRAEKIDSPDGVLAGDPTGCGDVWGATCCAALIAGAPIGDAILRAHRAAAAKIRYGKTTGLAAALASSNPARGVLP